MIVQRNPATASNPPKPARGSSATPPNDQSLAPLLFRAALLLAVAMIATTNAVVVTWDGDCGDSPSNTWSTECGLVFNTTNWDNNGVPGSGDDVVIAEGSGTTFLGANIAVQSVQISSDFQVSGQLTVSGASIMNGLSGGSAGDIFADGAVTFEGTNANTGVFLKGAAGYVNNGTFTVGNPIEDEPSVNVVGFVNNGTTNISGFRNIKRFINKGTAKLGDGGTNQLRAKHRFINDPTGMIEVETATNNDSHTIGGDFEMRGGTIHVRREISSSPARSPVSRARPLWTKAHSWTSAGPTTSPARSPATSRSPATGDSLPTTSPSTASSLSNSQARRDRTKTRVFNPAPSPPTQPTAFINNGFMSTAQFGTRFAGGGTLTIHFINQVDGVFEVITPLTISTNFENLGVMNVRQGGSISLNMLGGAASLKIDEGGTLSLIGDGQLISNNPANHELFNSFGTVLRNATTVNGLYTINHQVRFGHPRRDQSQQRHPAPQSGRRGPGSFRG